MYSGGKHPKSSESVSSQSKIHKKFKNKGKRKYASRKDSKKTPVLTNPFEESNINVVNSEGVTANVPIECNSPQVVQNAEAMENPFLKYCAGGSQDLSDESDSSNNSEKTKPTRRFLPKPDVVYMKVHPPVHPLSAELQKFYVELTEGVFGYSENIRNDCMRSIEKDYSMLELAPYLAVFIKETIERNIVFTELSLLVYAVKMVQNLMNNESVPLQKYLHTILPPVISCGVARTVCRNYTENHWTLRDLSAFVVSEICKKFNSNVTNITNRVIQIYLKPLRDTNNHSLTTIYGAVRGLASLGLSTVKDFLFPHIKNISPMIQTAEISIGKHSDERYKQFLRESKHVRDAVVSILAPILHNEEIIKFIREVYVDEFGYLGQYIFTEVKNIDLLEERKRKREQAVGISRSMIQPLKKVSLNPKEEKRDIPEPAKSPVSFRTTQPVIRKYAKRSSSSGSYELATAADSESDRCGNTSASNEPTPSTSTIICDAYESMLHSFESPTKPLVTYEFIGGNLEPISGKFESSSTCEPSSSSHKLSIDNYQPSSSYEPSEITSVNQKSTPEHYDLTSDSYELTSGNYEVIAGSCEPTSKNDEITLSYEHTSDSNESISDNIDFSSGDIVSISNNDYTSDSKETASANEENIFDNYELTDNSEAISGYKEPTSVNDESASFDNESVSISSEPTSSSLVHTSSENIPTTSASATATTDSISKAKRAFTTFTIRIPNTSNISAQSYINRKLFPGQSHGRPQVVSAYNIESYSDLLNLSRGHSTSPRNNLPMYRIGSNRHSQLITNSPSFPTPQSSIVTSVRSAFTGEPRHNLLGPSFLGPTLPSPYISTLSLPEPPASGSSVPGTSDPASISIVSIPCPSMSGPSTSGPSISGPSISDPSISDPSISEPPISDPSISDSSISGPSISGTSTSGPSIHFLSIPSPSVPGPSIHRPSLPGPSFPGPFIPGPSTQQIRKRNFNYSGTFNIDQYGEVPTRREINRFDPMISGFASQHANDDPMTSFYPNRPVHCRLPIISVPTILTDTLLDYASDYSLSSLAYGPLDEISIYDYKTDENIEPTRQKIKSRPRPRPRPRARPRSSSTRSHLSGHASTSSIDPNESLRKFAIYKQKRKGKENTTPKKK